ncbi:MAG: FAD-dependent tricarballylate dehydrogenase TcuA [Thermaerobacter sp.]|nr:FAD-dependent tricarballylate dehydrogenase TcuA [Thermaerobacter sp.]
MIGALPPADRTSRADALPERLSCDVLVVGGGHAALCAALSASARGADVLIAERAPAFFRGGNSRHTRDVRCLHDAASPYTSGAYGEEEFLGDLARVSGQGINERLARLTIAASAQLPGWMAAHGVIWQKPLRGTLHLSQTNVFMLGGGRAMLNAYYAGAQAAGVRTLYEANVHDFSITPEGRFGGATVTVAGVDHRVEAKAAVVSSGGFEANLRWLGQYWGDAVERFVVRGSPYNTGELLAELLEQGARPIGDPRQFHAVAVDGRAPTFDGGIVTRLDSVPFGIVVNTDGERFYDEGEDFWPKRYAIWGGLIARQKGQTAYSIIDSKALVHFLPSVFPPIQAPSVQELAQRLGVDPAAVASTVARFNASVRKGAFDPAALDDCCTAGLAPPKSHWARPIDTPPYYGYPLRPGITFTYMGVEVDQSARVQLASGRSAENIFAAGEIMSGNILKEGYLAGFGLTIGGVFGRIAGEGAADYALA